MGGQCTGCRNPSRQNTLPLQSSGAIIFLGKVVLPTSIDKELELIKRLTLIAKDDVVKRIFYPIFPQTVMQKMFSRGLVTTVTKACNRVFIVLKVRSVSESDIFEIYSFAKKMLTSPIFFFPKASFPLTPDQLSSAINQRSDSTVIEEQSVVLGFANFYRWGLQSICSIGNVVVSPDARNRGVAKLLMEHMIPLA